MYVHVYLQLETVGDCYIVVGGLMHTDGDGYTSVREDADPLHAVNVMRFAKVMHKQSGACIKLEYDWNMGLCCAVQWSVHSSNRGVWILQTVECAFFKPWRHPLCVIVPLHDNIDGFFIMPE